MNSISRVFKIKNSFRGITLIEVIVAVFIITIFFAILISDFPKIKRQFALSRAVHKFSQDIKMIQNKALSGVGIEGKNVKGYGIYINLANNKQYIIYADTYEPNDYEYTEGEIIDIVDISKENPGVIITGINNISVSSVSIDFSPPSPTTKISDLISGEDSVEVVFALENDPSIAPRKVSVNKAGLIEVK